MAAYKTPGVYIKEIRKFPPSVAQVETAIPAFIGHTEIAEKNGESLTNNPTRITSLLEYEKYFGGPQPEQHLVIKINQKAQDGSVTDEAISASFSTNGGASPSKHIMYYAVQLYFENGGGPCYIVSVGPYLGTFGEQIPLDPLSDVLDILEREDEPTLIVFPEGQGMSAADYFGLQNASLAHCNKMQDRFAVMDMHHSGEGLETSDDVLNEAVTPFRDGIRSEPDFVKYGAVYFPNVNSIFNYVYDEATVAISHSVNGTPGDLDGQTFPDLDSATTSKVKSAIDNFAINLPPSSAVVGVYARVDENRGVWKAPANENVVSIDGLSFKITDGIQDFLNVDVTAGKSINAIRSFKGKGTLIWGARTLAGNDNEWRYVPVRRFFNMVEESTKKASAQFVFEPNDANTWTKVKAMIENFLVLQWRAGALAGAVPEDAFYVKVGLNETMTALDILEGRMIVEIGMAVVRPAEFIILKFAHKMQES